MVVLLIFSLIIVSTSASSIAKLRSEKGLPALEVFVIDVVSSKGSQDAEADVETMIKLKMSSTTMRQWIVDHQTEAGSASK